MPNHRKKGPVYGVGCALRKGACLRGVAMLQQEEGCHRERSCFEGRSGGPAYGGVVVLEEGRACLLSGDA